MLAGRPILQTRKQANNGKDLSKHDTYIYISINLHITEMKNTNTIYVHLTEMKKIWFVSSKYFCFYYYLILLQTSTNSNNLNLTFDTWQPVCDDRNNSDENDDICGLIILMTCHDRDDDIDGLKLEPEEFLPYCHHLAHLQPWFTNNMIIIRLYTFFTLSYALSTLKPIHLTSKRI